VDLGLRITSAKANPRNVFPGGWKANPHRESVLWVLGYPENSSGQRYNMSLEGGGRGRLPAPRAVTNIVFRRYFCARLRRVTEHLGRLPAGWVKQFDQLEWERIEGRASQVLKIYRPGDPDSLPCWSRSSMRSGVAYPPAGGVGCLELKLTRSRFAVTSTERTPS
jgi:hypothetical protein